MQTVTDVCNTTVASLFIYFGIPKKFGMSVSVQFWFIYRNRIKNRAKVQYNTLTNLSYKNIRYLDI